MAIDAADMPLILREAVARPFAGALLTLGKQDVTLTLAQLRAVARDVALPRADGLDARAIDGPLDDATLFKALGFTSVDSMDVNGYEGATILHDLNAPSIPSALENRFDVVFDRGTTEHVFNVPNALAAMARMCAPGGRVMHLSPSTNHLDHGFVMFSPRLFADYYAANGFAIERIELARQPWLDRHPAIRLLRYAPGCLDGMAPGALGAGGYQVFVVARKMPGATHGRRPRFAEGAARGAGLSPVLRFTVRGAEPGRH
jgi:SAM-dependent methyltransferase